MRRNFQGFTDDPADILLGLGASAISAFPDRFVQNEKNSGLYRNRALAGIPSGVSGILRGREDCHRETIISSLLCAGSARIDGDLLSPCNLESLEAFRSRGLLELSGDRVEITEAGRPYSRVIASLFDAYRSQSEQRFSNAI